jgi:hypothetical protein
VLVFVLVYDVYNHKANACLKLPSRIPITKNPIYGRKCFLIILGRIGNYLNSISAYVVEH